MSFANRAQRPCNSDRPARHFRWGGALFGLASCLLGSCQRRDANLSARIDHVAASSIVAVASPAVADFRNVPLDLPPVYHPLQFLDDRELNTLLTQYVPSWEYRRIPDILHALRLWGPAADFSSAPDESRHGIVPLSGPRMVEILTLDPVFQSEFGKGTSYLLNARFGFSERLLEGYRSTPHVDDLLGVAAEVGLSLDTPVRTASSTGTLADVLRQSLMSFDIRQELEFTAVAYAGYLPPTKTWKNRFGTVYSFDDLCRALLKPGTLPRTCGGTHVPFSLLRIWRADQVHPILSPDVRTEIENDLTTLSQQLTKTQTDEGYWSANNREATMTSPDADLGRLRIAGHHLEWFAFAPQEFCPPVRTIRLAADWVYGALRRQPKLMRFAAYQYPESSHAVRALFLLHGKAVALSRPSPATIQP
jgi:hypothetical protein